MQTADPPELHEPNNGESSSRTTLPGPTEKPSMNEASSPVARQAADGAPHHDEARVGRILGITTNDNFKVYYGLDPDLQQKASELRDKINLSDEEPESLTRDQDEWQYDFLTHEETEYLRTNMVFEDDFPEGFQEDLVRDGDEDDLFGYWTLIDIIHKIMRSIEGAEFFDWDRGRSTLKDIHTQLARRLYPSTTTPRQKRKKSASKGTKPNKMSKGSKKLHRKKSKSEGKKPVPPSDSDDSDSSLKDKTEKIQKLLENDPEAKINHARKLAGIKPKDTKNAGLQPIAQKLKQKPSPKSHLNEDAHLTNEIIDSVEKARKHGGLSDKTKQEAKPRVETRPSSEWNWVTAAETAKISDPYERHCAAEYAYDYRGKLLQRVWHNVLNATDRNGNVIMSPEDRDRVIGNTAQWRRHKLLQEHPWMDDVLDADCKPRTREHSRIILNKDPKTGKQKPWSKKSIEEVIQRGEQACCDMLSDAGWRSVRDNFFMNEFEKLKNGELDPHMDKIRDERALLDRESWQMIKDRIFFNNWTKDWAQGASNEILAHKKRVAKELIHYQEVILSNASVEVQEAEDAAATATQNQQLLDDHFQLFGRHYNETIHSLHQARAENMRLQKQIVQLQAEGCEPDMQAALRMKGKLSENAPLPKWRTFVPPQFPISEDKALPRNLMRTPIHTPASQQPTSPHPNAARAPKPDQQKERRAKANTAVITDFNASVDKMTDAPQPTNFPTEHGTNLCDADELPAQGQLQDAEEAEGQQLHT
ncbi:hypothetical protein Vi05172_g6512 [Venturia inaequalis]|nr:hypothetical protein Vi05172_g6512 [Venturia inaequalis]